MHLEAGPVQHRVNRDPIDPGGFHRHHPYPTRGQPGSQCHQIVGATAKAAHHVLTPPGIHGDVMPLLADINTGTIRMNNLETVMALLA